MFPTDSVPRLRMPRHDKRHVNCPHSIRPHGSRRSARLIASQTLGGLGGGSPTSEGGTTSLPFRKAPPTGAGRRKGGASGNGAVTTPKTHRTASGQSLRQSGIIGLLSGQHGMSSGIDKAARAATALEDDAPKGANARPNTTSSNSILPKPSDFVICDILACAAIER